MKKIEAGNLTRRGAGRPKGVPNKTTTKLKEAILAAGEEAGGNAGLVGYLVTLAKDQPNAFAGLLGKVLPLQVAGDKDNPFRTVSEVRHIIVD